MTARFPLHLIYTMTCSACGVQAKEEWHIHGRDSLPRPSVPYQWRLVERRLYCDRHQVELQVDGKRSDIL